MQLYNLKFEFIRYYDFFLENKFLNPGILHLNLRIFRTVKSIGIVISIH